MAIQSASGYQHQNLYDISKKYGKLARIGPNHLISNDPEIQMRMSATASPYRRSDFYNAFRFTPREDHIFSLIDEKKHTDLRRRVAPAYGGKDVPHIESQIQKHVTAWVDLIKRSYISTDTETIPADLSSQAQYFTLDAITDIAFDQPFGDLALDQDRFDFAKSTKDALTIMSVLTVFTDVYKLLETFRIVDLVAPTQNDKKGLGPALLMARNAVAKRFAEPELKQKPDMLGSHLRHGLSQRQAEEEALVPL
jgi:cytochrome P450